MQTMIAAGITAIRVSVTDLQRDDYLAGSKALVISNNYSPTTGKRRITVEYANGTRRSADWGSRTTMVVERAVIGELA
jgi:hypothetical protein